MATYYVYSGAAGANNGSSWTDAYTAFASAAGAGASSVFESAITNHISVAALDSSKAVVTYHDAGYGGYGTACVLSISGTTVTAGTPVVFESATTSYISVAMLDSSKAIVTYQDVGNSNYGTACVLSISGTTVTAGTPVVFESATTSYTSVAMLDSSKAVVTYQDGGNSSYGTACVLSISGTTVTAGTPVVFESATTLYISVAMLDSSKAIVTYRDAGNANYGTACVLSISGTTVTAGTPVVFESANTTYISVAALDSSKAVVTYRDDGNANYGTACVLSISGTTVTAGTPVVFGSATTNYTSVTMLDSSKAVVMYQDNGNSNYGTACVLSISGTTVTAGPPVVFESATTNYTSVAMLGSSNAVVTYQDAGNSYYGTARIVPVDGTVVFPLTTIKIHKTHTENLGSDTTYRFDNDTAILCVDKDSSDALATMDGGTYRIGSTTSRAIAFNSSGRVYCYGVALDIGGTTAKTLTLGQGDEGHFEFDNCKIWMSGSGANVFSLGNSGTSSNTFIRLRGCDIRFGAASQYIRADGGRVEWVGGQINASGSAPTTLILPSQRSILRFEGVDLSQVTGVLVGSAHASGVFLQEFVSCRFGSGVVVMAAQTTANRGSAEVFMFNCHSGDSHYAFGHYDGLGSTIIETGIYANDGASPDGGTTRTSWKIVTTSGASFYTPYRSPWFDKYHSGTSAITPYFEILRDGSATAFNDDEVWGEFSIQATTGSVLPVFKDDRMTPLGTPAAQTNSSKTASDWTGENATAWFGKIAAPSATTPAEVGYLRARCVVGKASTTVYLDPTIRT